MTYKFDEISKMIDTMHTAAIARFGETQGMQYMAGYLQSIVSRMLSGTGDNIYHDPDFTLDLIKSSTLRLIAEK